MPDVGSIASAYVSLWVALDVHKLSIVAATLPPAGGRPEICRIETADKAIRQLIDRLGGPGGLAVCYEAGPGGYALWRLLTAMGVACDIVAPSLRAVGALRLRQPLPDQGRYVHRRAQRDTYTGHKAKPSGPTRLCSAPQVHTHNGSTVRVIYRTGP